MLHTVMPIMVTEQAIVYHGAFSSLSSFISANIRLMSLSVRVGGTMRANMAPNCNARQHIITKSNDRVDLPMYTDLRNEAPTQRHSCPNMYHRWSDPRQHE